MIGTHIPLYLLAVVVIIVMCFDWWWWWCSVFTSHNHQSSMTPEKTQQATQWQVSLLASRTPPHSSPMQTWGKIRKWKIFFARRTRRSCHCSSLQSDPCHPGGNPQATWTCIGKLLNIFGEVQNIFGAFQVKKASPSQSPTSPIDWSCSWSKPRRRLSMGSRLWAFGFKTISYFGQNNSKQWLFGFKILFDIPQPGDCMWPMVVPCHLEGCGGRVCTLCCYTWFEYVDIHLLVLVFYLILIIYF